MRALDIFDPGTRVEERVRKEFVLSEGAGRRREWDNEF